MALGYNLLIEPIDHFFPKIGQLADDGHGFLIDQNNIKAGGLCFFPGF